MISSFRKNYREAHAFKRNHPNAPLIKCGSAADRVCNKIVTVLGYCVAVMCALFAANVCIHTMLDCILGA